MRRLMHTGPGQDKITADRKAAFGLISGERSGKLCWIYKKLEFCPKGIRYYGTERKNGVLTRREWSNTTVQNVKMAFWPVEG